MANSGSHITELATTLLYAEGNNSFHLRVIEFPNSTGEVVRKFGLSELWFCENSKRWYPSKKHHVYLPLCAWSNLVKHASLVEQFVNANDGPRKYGPSDKRDRAVGPANAANDQSLRRRGRPPKRAHADSTQRKDQGTCMQDSACETSPEPGIAKRACEEQQRDEAEENERDVRLEIVDNDTACGTAAATDATKESV
jgi:hypothetical protein